MNLGSVLLEACSYVALGGALALTVIPLEGGFGARSSKEVYSFLHNGQEASIIYEDIRLGPDRYKIIFNGGEIREGFIKTDDHKVISLDPKKTKASYSVQNASNNLDSR